MRTLLLLCCVLLPMQLARAQAGQLDRLIQEAQQAEKNGNLEEAVRLYRKMLEVRRHWIPAEFKLAVAYDAEQKYPEAIRILSEIIQHDPSMASAYLLRGKAYYEINRYPKALQSLKRALELQPKNPQVHFFLAATYYQLNDYGHAALAYLEQIRMQPQESDFYFQLVQCYEALQHIALEQIHESSDASYFALLLEAEKDIGRGDMARAQTQLQSALENNSARPEAWLVQGRKEERQGHLDQAAISFQKAQERNDRDSLRFRGTIAAEIRPGDLCPPGQELAAALCRASREDLLGATRRVLAATPADHRDARSRYWSFRIYGRLRQMTVSRLAELAPNSPGLHKLYARNFSQNGRNAEAAKEYEKALAADDQDASSFVEYANFRLQAQAFGQAIALLQKALDLTPHDFNARTLLARAYLQHGEPALAVPQFAEVLKATPGDEQSRIDFAECLYSLERTSEAIAALEAAPADPDGRIAYVLARYYARRGEQEKAQQARGLFRQRHK